MFHTIKSNSSSSSIRRRPLHATATNSSLPPPADFEPTQDEAQSPLFEQQPEVDELVEVDEEPDKEVDEDTLLRSLTLRSRIQARYRGKAHCYRELTKWF